VIFLLVAICLLVMAPVYVVTGGSIGLGLYASIELAKQGGTVVIAARNPARLAEAVERVKAASAEAGGTAVGIELDLSSLANVKCFADDLLAKYPGQKVRLAGRRERRADGSTRGGFGRAGTLFVLGFEVDDGPTRSPFPSLLILQLQGLVLNAGINTPKFAWSKDGIESTWATNHLVGCRDCGQASLCAGVGRGWHCPRRSRYVALLQQRPPCSQPPLRGQGVLTLPLKFSHFLTPQGHFYLAQLLLPHLAPDGRIVVTSRCAWHLMMYRAQSLPEKACIHAMLKGGFVCCCSTYTGLVI
jgi:NAD(P)-dependent dehydrogenase (short-subunit alcohol dehydrogenase family)